MSLIATLCLRKIDIVEYGGIITVSYIQNFEGSEIIGVLTKLLRELVPETILEDLGEKTFDSFDLSRFIED